MPYEHEGVKYCEYRNCGAPLVDRSPNHSRRYCSKSHRDMEWVIRLPTGRKRARWRREKQNRVAKVGYLDQKKAKAKAMADGRCHRCLGPNDGENLCCGSCLADKMLYMVTGSYTTLR